MLDGAPSHSSEEIVCPQNVDFLRLPAYSPALDPVERGLHEFRRELSNKTFEIVELLQEALGQALRPYWEERINFSSLQWRVLPPEHEQQPYGRPVDEQRQ